MKKNIALILALSLLACLLAGCAGTPVVYYSNCTCPTGSHTQDVQDTLPPVEGALKTGLAIVTNLSGSKNAEKADYDITVVAVTVDENNVIVDCIIDSVAASIAFDATGTITDDVSKAFQTKNELGDAYGMKAYGNAKYEWYEQAAALADYAKGKTVEQLRTGAVNESGKAQDADLAATATIKLGGYVDAIEEAVKTAQVLGAQAGDTLRMAVTLSAASSVSATAEKAGTAQMDCNVIAITEKDGVITGCAIDAVQAKVSFDTTGTITTDLTAAVLTKNQLGEGYGMKAWGNAKYEWNEQAASFAAYITGKTAAEVAGIAVTEGKPADADLAATVTIKIGDFQALVEKAMQ